jgi:thiamine biosynthesis lipoprotein
MTGLRIEAGIARWSVWSTTASLVVTDPAALDAARELVRAELAAVDAACSRFRPDAELARAEAVGGPVAVSPLLAELVGAALTAAAESDGAVDPTLGNALAELGYDRDLATVAARGPAIPVVLRPAPGWRRIELQGRELTVPRGIRLDLGATAKAHAADRCARLVAGELGVGVLVELGGDLATAGPAPVGDWVIRVRDGADQPASTVRLPGGAAMASSSTGSRSWRRGDRLLHHVLDPRTSQPASRVWRTATVVADTCLAANTHSTAALVRGRSASPWLTRTGLPARLVSPTGRVHRINSWPMSTEDPT